MHDTALSGLVPSGEICRWDKYTADYLVRQRVTTHLTFPLYPRSQSQCLLRRSRRRWEVRFKQDDDGRIAEEIWTVALDRTEYRVLMLASAECADADGQAASEGIQREGHQRFQRADCRKSYRNTSTRH
jgi:hypothetical protein